MPKSNLFKWRLQSTNDSWRVDETYVKIKGKDRYLYNSCTAE
ncbi:MAG: DDE-type integrase/transposase/recombinase [Chroococcidiopsidaceae cyanobacterium CP_BM_RX_35]|nr:DDE-type integrase/transposase/recombinase [Chroococcidiopsidaceae cyanobacterium CP_BM_RX_35]